MRGTSQAAVSDSQHRRNVPKPSVIEEATPTALRRETLMGVGHCERVGCSLTRLVRCVGVDSILLRVHSCQRCRCKGAECRSIQRYSTTAHRSLPFMGNKAHTSQKSSKDASAASVSTTPVLGDFKGEPVAKLLSGDDVPRIRRLKQALEAVPDLGAHTVDFYDACVKRKNVYTSGQRCSSSSHPPDPCPRPFCRCSAEKAGSSLFFSRTSILLLLFSPLMT